MLVKCLIIAFCKSKWRQVSNIVLEGLYGNTVWQSKSVPSQMMRKTGESYMNSDLAERMMPTMLDNLLNSAGGRPGLAWSANQET